MSIVQHPGFQQALNACEMTAFEICVVQELVAATEEFFADFSRCPIDADPHLEPSRLGQEAYPMSPDLSSERYIASELLKRLRELFASSSFCTSCSSMTASEIAALAANNLTSEGCT